MQNLFLKLTAVVGIAGIGSLVALQLQRGSNEAGEESVVDANDGTAAAPDENSKPAAKPDAADVLGEIEPQFVRNAPGGQSEPEASASEPEPAGRPIINPAPRSPADETGTSAAVGRGIDFREIGPRLLPAGKSIPGANDLKQTAADTGATIRREGERLQGVFELLDREDAADGSGEKVAQIEHTEQMSEEPDADAADSAADADDDSEPNEPRLFPADEPHHPIEKGNDPDAGSVAKAPGRLPLFRRTRPLRSNATTQRRDEIELGLDETPKKPLEPNDEVRPPFSSGEGAVERASAEQQPPNGELASPGTKEPATSLAQSSEPQRLQPNAGAAPIAKPPAAATAGDGTVGRTLPQGMQRPQLTVEKTAPKNALLGQPFVYHILVENVGATTANDVVVDDLIPKGTKLVGTIPQAQLAGTRLTWQLGKLKPGEEKKISVRAIPIAEGIVGSVANVRFTAEVAAQTVVSSPKLKLAVDAPEQAKLGEPVVLKFKVTNNSPADATGVTLRDVIPKGLKHADGNDLEYEVGTIPAGATRELELVLTAAEVGDAVNRVVVTADGAAAAEVRTSTAVVGAPLKIERIGSSRRYLGRPTTFENRVTNESSIPVVGATVIEVIPAGLQFVEASDGGQYNPKNRSIVWAVGKLDPKQSKVFKAKLIPRTLGTQTSTLKVIGPNGAAAQSVAETGVVGFTTLGVDVQAVGGGGGPSAVGEQANYRIVVNNRGTVPATDIRVSINVPAETQLVQFPNMLKPVDGGKVHPLQPIGRLDPGQQATIEIGLKALRQGDARLGVSVQSEQMQRPLSREEAILILPPAP